MQQLHQYDGDWARHTGSYAQLPQMKQHFMQWLLATKREEKAADFNARGQPQKAIELFLQLVSVAGHHTIQQLPNRIRIAQRVAAALQKQHLYEDAGAVYEQLGQIQRWSYVKGKAFRQAIKVASVHQPQQVQAKNSGVITSWS